ncbi:electron transfer flavoprotein subunit beta/FixA family protein [soil metagenome]
MKILCLLKQVPDPNAVSFDSDGKLAANTARAVNEYDEYGLEAALQTKEARDDVEITVLSLGPGAVKDAVSRGLAMGADKGVLIRSDDPQRGSLQTARAIAGFASGDEFDLIWLGHESSDSGTGHVGPQLSVLLGMPFVSNVVGFELSDDNTALITREIEDGHAQVKASLPLALCALSGLDEPRYPSLKGIMAARRKPVEELTIEDLDVEASDASWGALREEERTISGTIIDDEDPAEAARKLVEQLQERGLI